MKYWKITSYYNTADSVADNTNSTNSINTVSSSVSTARANFDNINNTNSECFSSSPVDNIGIFRNAYDDREVGTETDKNNLELLQPVSPIPTTRIHKDHPKEQIIGDPQSSKQTRSMIKKSIEHAMVSYISKQRRTNHKDFQNCLLSCFLSQIEPKKVSQALTDYVGLKQCKRSLCSLRFKMFRLW
ncbi:hypothetical protein Tco_0828867 [Tanacetum coccineum]